MTCGIYRIQIDKRCYIGSATNIEKRIKQHRNALRRGSHHNAIMQHVWNKYQDLTWSILEECAEEALLDVEQKYLDLSSDDKMRMNLSSHSNRPATYSDMSPEKQAEWSSKLSSACTGENNPFYGKTHSEETRALMSAAKLGKSPPNKGKLMSDEQKALLSQRAKEQHARIRAAKEMETR